MTAVLRIDGLHKTFGALAATRDVSLAILPGELHALIGPNGAGKTTLIAQIMGSLTPDAGRILLDGHDITRLAPHLRARRGLARSFQMSSLAGELSALENVALAVQGHSAAPLSLFRRAATDEALNAPARAALDAVGLAARADLPAGVLSHGERHALELACALATAPRCLLLDEPLAGMGHDEAARIIALLGELKGRFAILLVEHDMDAVFALADRVSVLINGAIAVSGTPAEIRANPDVRAAYLGDALAC